MSGVSVTTRIKEVKQPRGGYLPPKQFKITILGEGMDVLHPEENIAPQTIGIVVDYLTRFMTGTTREKAFRISLMGAEIANQLVKAKDLLHNITGLDETSIIAATKLSQYDVYFRTTPPSSFQISDTKADKATIQNIKTMVERSLHFFEIYGEKVLDGFNMVGGYTDVVNSGDGDFITKDTLWDFKVSKSPYTSKHTLQLLMYYLMGQRSIHSEFDSIEYLGFFNPRTNTVAHLPIEEIPQEVIDQVSHDVIGYPE